MNLRSKLHLVHDDAPRDFTAECFGGGPWDGQIVTADGPRVLCARMSRDRSLGTLRSWYAWRDGVWHCVGDDRP